MKQFLQSAMKLFKWQLLDKKHLFYNTKNDFIATYFTIHKHVTFLFEF